MPILHLCCRAARTDRSGPGLPPVLSLAPKTVYRVPPHVVVLAIAVVVLPALLLVGLILGLRWSRKRAAEDLQEARNRYQAIFDSVNDAIFIHDPKTSKILDVNSRMLEMYGYATVDEVRDLGLGQLSAGTTPYTEQDALARIEEVRSGTPQLVEWHARHKDGHLFWVEVNVRLADIAGVERVLVVVRDITERKQTQDALAATEERYRSLVDNIDLGITLIDKDYNILMTNAHQSGLYNRPTCEFVGRKCFAAFEQTDDTCPHCPGRQAWNRIARSTGRLQAGATTAANTRLPCVPFPCRTAAAR